MARQLASYSLSKDIQSAIGSVGGTHQAGTLSGPLTDTDVRFLLSDAAGVRIDGVEQKNLLLHGWSIDLTLSPKYYRVAPRRIYKRVFDLVYGNVQDMLSRFREVVAAEYDGIYLRPNEFILASTREKLTLPDNIVGFISGRSSYARMGISIDLSQIIVQPGHSDTIPLQIKNNLPYPMVVYPGTPIAQIVFFRAVSASSSPYSKSLRPKYLGSLADNRSKYYDDPIYELIREKKPPKAKFDWEYFLNGALFFAAWATVIAFFTSTVRDPTTSEAAKMVGIVTLIFLTLVALVRGILLIKRDK